MPAAAFGAPQTIVSVSLVPTSTAQTRKRSAFGMLRERLDAADHHLVERRGRGNGLLDFETAHGEPFAQLGAADARIAHRAQPAFRELHANCLRKRRSFS